MGFSRQESWSGLIKARAVGLSITRLRSAPMWEPLLRWGWGAILTWQRAFWGWERNHPRWSSPHPPGRQAGHPLPGAGLRSSAPHLSLTPADIEPRATVLLSQIARDSSQRPIQHSWALQSLPIQAPSWGTGPSIILLHRIRNVRARRAQHPHFSNKETRIQSVKWFAIIGNKHIHRSACYLSSHHTGVSLTDDVPAAGVTRGFVKHSDLCITPSEGSHSEKTTVCRVPTI